VLTATFEDAVFQLFFDMPDGEWHGYVPTEADRARDLEVYSTTVTGGALPLPRGIKIGDSQAKVRAAYPGVPYREAADGDGAASLFYRYGGGAPLEYGVTYTFEHGRLISARVEWPGIWIRFNEREPDEDF